MQLRAEAAGVYDQRYPAPLEQMPHLTEVSSWEALYAEFLKRFVPIEQDYQVLAAQFGLPSLRRLKQDATSRLRTPADDLADLGDLTQGEEDEFRSYLHHFCDLNNCAFLQIL